jgi:hypothetical protein
MPAAAAVVSQPRLAALLAAGEADGLGSVRVTEDDGEALTRVSAVAVGEGLTVGNALGDAMRAWATYSSPPRSLREPPEPDVWVWVGVEPPPPGVLVCVAGVVGWLVPGGSEAVPVGSVVAGGLLVWGGVEVGWLVGPVVEGSGTAGMAAAACCRIPPSRG